MLIVGLATCGCASTGPQPTDGAIARIETELALIEDLQTVGVAHSESMNRAARTRVRNVSCITVAPGAARCAYESTRRIYGNEWTARRRVFLQRERGVPGTPWADGWAVGDDPTALLVE